MFKIIMYSIISIIIIHFILYYSNFDFDFILFKPKKEQVMNKIKSKIDNINIIDESCIELNQSINELKTLNECINNGKIDRSFS